MRDTVHRALSLVDASRLAILAGADLVSQFKDLLPDLEEECFWVEPRARGTGPVLAWAAHRIHRMAPKAVLVSLHADHRIEPESSFSALIAGAAEIARRDDVLMSVAVSPDRAETGYGYIRPGDPLHGSGSAEAFRVAEFVEKPDLVRAQEYLSLGYLWNSGIFILPASRLLEEIRIHAPEIGNRLPMLDRGEDDAFFEAVPTVSIDESVLERSGRVAAARADFHWDDVGSWEAIARTLPPDTAGNCGRGEFHAVDSTDALVWAEDGPVVLFGVNNLVVVRSGGVTLVASRERSPELKSLLAQLPEGVIASARGRPEE